MTQRGMSLPLTGLVIIVMVVILIAIISGSFYSRTANASNSQKANANSSDLRWCEENVNSFCRFNPGQSWSSTYQSCEKYKDVIDENGDTSCSGTPDEYSTAGGSLDDGGSSSDEDKPQEPPEEETQLYDVYFVPSSESYGQTQEYRNRVNTYFQAIETMTPFKEARCENVPYKIVFEQPSTKGDRNWDLLINVSDSNVCNAEATTPGGPSKITIFNGIPDSYHQQVVVHEMGHEFGLCDEYSYDRYKDNKELLQGAGFDGCGNDWPGHDGWYPGGNIVDEQGDAIPGEKCNQLSSQTGENPPATCGKALDIDGDGDYADDRKASIMGGGGAFQSTIEDGEITHCSGVWIEQPALSTQAYQAMKKEILRRGYCSNDDTDGGDPVGPGPIR